MSVFDDLTLQGRLFQIDGAAFENECMHTEGRQRKEVYEKKRIAGRLVL